MKLRLLLVLLIIACFAHPLPVRGKAATGVTLIVNAEFDDFQAHDATPGDGFCVDATGVCTLRAAIEEANSLPGADTITFASAMTIFLSAAEGAFPDLTESVTIDASGVWNATDGVPGVTINGRGANVNGFTIAALYGKIYGLYITDFGLNGVWVEAANSAIGGPGAGEGNVLSGNGAAGVSVVGEDAYGATIQGNTIGLNPAGDQKDANGLYGIYVGGGVRNTLIGGDVWAEGNIVSGNGGGAGGNVGIYITDADTRNTQLGANAIGIAADGVTELGNAGFGVAVNGGAGPTLIGGSGLLANTIAGNGDSGVHIGSGVFDTSIQDNAIRDNGYHGIYIFNGRDSDIMFNVIAANAGDGVRVQGASATANLISGNSIDNNGSMGIRLLDGGNGELAAPSVRHAAAGGASGKATGGARFVTVYSDLGDEGNVYHGIAIVDLTTKVWAFSGAISGPNVTALAHDAAGNTSEFSLSLPLGTTLTRRAFLPLPVGTH